MCCLQEIHFKYKGQIKSKEIKMYHANTNQKKNKVAILISNKVNFRAKKTIRKRRWALHTDKGANSPRRHNNLEHGCT